MSCNTDHVLNSGITQSLVTLQFTPYASAMATTGSAITTVQTIAGAVRYDGATATLTSISVIESDNAAASLLKKAIRIWIFGKSGLTATAGAVPTITTTELQAYVLLANVDFAAADYDQIDDVAIVQANNLNIPVRAYDDAGSQSLYALIVTNESSVDYNSSSRFDIRLCFAQD